VESIPASADPIAGWVIKPDPEGEGWLLFGECPRCRHDCEKVIREGVIVLALAGAPEDRPDVGTHVVQCNCQSPHAGRPADVNSGCGAYWGVELQHTPPEKAS
jgi:hypothetical protein